jgi:hypothetical protein
VAASLTCLAHVAHDRGELAQAVRLYRESLTIQQPLENKSEIMACLEGIAAAFCARGQIEHAVRLCAAAAALRDALGILSPPIERARRGDTLVQLRASAGEDRFGTLWAEGEAMPLERAISIALEPARVCSPAPM